MNRKKATLFVLVLALFGPLTGCWSNQEIEAAGFATWVGIDRTENGEIELTFGLAVTESLAGGGGNGGGGGSDVPVWTVSSAGKNLAEAIAASREFTGRLPFWFHTEAVIIGEDLAKAGISPVLDYMLRTRDFRLNTPILVSEGKAKDVLQLSPKITKLPGRYLGDLLAVSREESVAKRQVLLDVVKILTTDMGEGLFIPLIHPKPKEPTEGKMGTGEGGEGEAESGGSKPKEKPEALVLQGSAIFVGDKMIGKLDGAETRGMLWLRGETQRATVIVNMAEGRVVQQQLYARRTLRLLRDGERLRAVITVFQDGDIIEHEVDKHIELNAAALKEMDAALTETIQTEVNAVLRKLQQELRADTLGIGTRAHRQYPDLFDALDWQEFFPQLPIEVIVRANFRRTGESAQSPLVR